MCVSVVCVSGGFSQMYACVCDWLGFSYREEVQWVSVFVCRLVCAPPAAWRIFQYLKICLYHCLILSLHPSFLIICVDYLHDLIIFKQDVDTIYLTQDTRELNLQDFSHLDHR